MNDLDWERDELTLFASKNKCLGIILVMTIQRPFFGPACEKELGEVGHQIPHVVKTFSILFRPKMLSTPFVGKLFSKVYWDKGTILDQI